ncbi:hypothetical protein DB347_02625 [Opitutaceae bacterium EW11]|nr:hypothetical protein DB347_02625 [Opitutaceae bacterium EW11]
MNWNQIRTVYGKEMRDALRDRRTLLSMLLVPALVIPGIMFAFTAVSLKVVKKAAEETPAVMIIGPGNSEPLQKALAGSPKLRLVPAASDYAQQISDKRIRAAVEIPPGFEADLAANSIATVKIYTYEGEMKSSFAAGEIDRILREFREAAVTRKLGERGLNASFVRPFEIKRQNVAPPEKVGGNLFGGFVPYLLIILSVVGAMYPAIDLTAGEKERGTMETILCSPVGRVELVLGKFLTVLTISLSTVVTSITSMALSAVGLVHLFAGKVGAGAKAVNAATGQQLPMVDPVGVLGVMVMVLPLAVVFSALLFSVSLFAKSHKEAQTYASPILFLTILPAMAAMLPGVELNAKLALIPVLNVSLIGKEMVSGSFRYDMMALIFGSSCLYGAAALAVAVRLFNRESVLFRT